MGKINEPVLGRKHHRRGYYRLAVVPGRELFVRTAVLCALARDKQSNPGYKKTHVTVL